MRDVTDFPATLSSATALFNNGSAVTLQGGLDLPALDLDGIGPAAQGQGVLTLAGEVGPGGGNVLHLQANFQQLAQD